MSEQTIIKTTFQLKRGTANAWEAQNPILAPGEPGVELDRENHITKLKIGDGIAEWNELPYAAGDGISADSLADVIASSEGVKRAIAGVVEDLAIIHFRGEATSAEDDPLDNTRKIALYDANLDEIDPHPGDVYLYDGVEYVYDDLVSRWIPLAESSFNSVNDLATKDDIQTLQDLIANPAVATANKPGVVKSSSSVNGITVNADGTMTINDLSVEKLTVLNGTELILNGGSAT